MEIDWNTISLPQSLLDDSEFKTAVKNTLRMEWPPPDGLIQDMDEWLRNYKTWHRHLISIESFQIPLDVAINTYGLPYYTPAENPDNFIDEISRVYVQRDIDERLELMEKAKDKYDARWYMISHICYFNATTMGIIAKHLWPNRSWKIIESRGHVLVTDGSKEQVYQYLKNGIYDPQKPFHILDAVVHGREMIGALMLNDADRWVVYNSLDNYAGKCYREFFFNE